MHVTRRRRLARALVAAAVALATASSALPAAAAADPAPGLAVSVPERCGFLLLGEPTPLRVVVRNDTGTLLPGVTLTPRLPAGFTAQVTREPSPLLPGRSASFHVAVTAPADADVAAPVTLAFDVAGGAERATVTLTQYVVAAPVAPTAVVVTAGDAHATVTWQPGPARSAYPDAAGAAPRRTYVVTASPGGARTTVFDTTTATVVGLDNGTAYTFTVAEWNPFGETASAASAPVVPRGVPGAVRYVGVSGDGETRIVFWDAPPDNGSPITGYTVTTYPGGDTVVAPPGATEVEVTGLVDGAEYVFTVRAANALGDAPDSPRPDGVPAAHGHDMAIDSYERELSVVLGFPDGEPTVDGWHVTVQPAGIERYVPRPTPANIGGETLLQFPGLTPDTTYAVTVRGVNAAGVGPPATASETIVADPEPVVVTGGVGRLDVVDYCFLGGWDRGSDVTAYLFTEEYSTESHVVDAGHRVAAIPATYWYPRPVDVVAASLGAGRYWLAARIAPAVAAQRPAPALEYGFARRDHRSATLEWRLAGGWSDSPGDIEIVVSPGGKTIYARPEAAPLTVPGLTPGVEYTFTVRRLDANGYGPALVTQPVVPFDVPAKVTGVTVTAVPDEPGVAIVSWDPVVGNGLEVESTRVLRDGGVVTHVAGWVTSSRVQVGPGMSHTFEVVARNSWGEGEAGVSAPFTYPVDTTPPDVVVTAPPAVTTSGRATVSYGAPDAVSYDTRYRIARYDGDFGAYRDLTRETISKTAAVAARPGWTYCFGVRARDGWGNVSEWTADACTTAPVDDAALWATGAWTRGASSPHYNGTYSSTVAAGTALTLSRVANTRRLALVATRCPTCGEVGVYVGGTLVKRVKLTAATRSYRQVVTVDLGVPRTARVTLERLAGRPYVDGLAALRTPPE